MPIRKQRSALKLQYSELNSTQSSPWAVRPHYTSEKVCPSLKRASLKNRRRELEIHRLNKRAKWEIESAQKKRKVSILG